MKIIFLTTIIMLSFVASGQTLPTNTDYYATKNATLDYSDFNGSLYLDEEFKPSVVIDKLAKKEENIFLRYDALNDFFEMRKSPKSGAISFLKKEASIDIKIDNDLFTYETYKAENDKIERGYLHHLGRLNGNMIYAKYSKQVKMPVKAKTTLETDKKGRLTDDVYFLSDNERVISPIKLKKKSILSNLNKEHQSLVKTYVKKNSLKYNEPEDLKLILSFIENL